MTHDLDLAERELRSLLSKCESVLDRDTPLSPSRHTLMVNRVAALRTALSLIEDALRHRASGPTAGSDGTGSAGVTGRQAPPGGA